MQAHARSGPFVLLQMPRLDIRPGRQSHDGPRKKRLADISRLRGRARAIIGEDPRHVTCPNRFGPRSASYDSLPDTQRIQARAAPESLAERDGEVAQT